MRPLDRVSSIKLKLSIVIVMAVAISAIVSTVGLRTGIPVWVRPPIATVIALAVVYPIARGMTSPLRQMVHATTAMAEGRPTEPVVVTSNDEVGELARSFNAMRAQLDEVDRQRRDLVANVSHELRTPLSALQATLENIADGVEPADPDRLALMLAQTRRLGRMVSQLLDLSRLESGGSPLQPSQFPVAEVLEQARGEASLHWPAVEVRVSCDEGLTMVGDAERVHQVVANLVENAVRHSPSGSPVQVAARAADGAVVIEVADEGPGIAPEEAEQVFERFYRADLSRSVEGGGSGLGLAIVRWIVDLHGGEVRVDTSRTTGCRMTVVLPMAPEVTR
ncbi:MAG: HAMP domain-containing protein [Acidimicrobiia bacterium]|nr:HAMP domain-containing protein [Acidimicrobiia bacterium]